VFLVSAQSHLVDNMFTDVAILDTYDFFYRSDPNPMKWKYSVVQNNSAAYQEATPCSRYTLWEGSSQKQCHGQTIREICHLSIYDLSAALTSKCFVANKFDFDIDSRPIMCLSRKFSPFQML
jgi:hypothetical protein